MNKFVLLMTFFYLFAYLPLGALAPSHHINSLKDVLIISEKSHRFLGERGEGDRTMGIGNGQNDNHSSRYRSYAVSRHSSSYMFEDIESDEEWEWETEDDEYRESDEAWDSEDDEESMDENDDHSLSHIEEFLEDVYSCIVDEEDDMVKRVQTIEAFVFTAYIGYVILSSPWGLPFYIATLLFKSYVDAHPNRLVSKIFNYLFVYPINFLPLLFEVIIIYFDEKFPSLKISQRQVTRLILYKLLIWTSAFFLVPQFCHAVSWAFSELASASVQRDFLLLFSQMSRGVHIKSLALTFEQRASSTESLFPYMGTMSFLYGDGLALDFACVVGVIPYNENRFIRKRKCTKEWSYLQTYTTKMASNL